MDDTEKLADDVFEAVSDYVSRALRPLLQRVAELEDRQPQKGEPGQDGVGVAGAAINRSGDLMITLSNGKILMLGQVDGRDGLGFDDLSVDHDGERLVTFRFVQGERVKEFPVTFPALIYRDVYRPEKAYVRGDVVTFGGSMWHCNAATEEKPGDGSAAWTLAAKRGRDGRDGTLKEGKGKQNGSAAHA